MMVKEIKVQRQDTLNPDYNTPYDTTENDEQPKYIEFEGKYERVPVVRLSGKVKLLVKDILKLQSIKVK